MLSLHRLQAIFLAVAFSLLPHSAHGQTKNPLTEEEAVTSKTFNLDYHQVLIRAHQPLVGYIYDPFQYAFVKWNENSFELHIVHSSSVSTDQKELVDQAFTEILASLPGEYLEQVMKSRGIKLSYSEELEPRSVDHDYCFLFYRAD